MDHSGMTTRMCSSSETDTTQLQTHLCGRGPSLHLTCTVWQHVSCHFILSGQLIKALNHWRSKCCHERRPVEAAQWTMNSNNPSLNIFWQRTDGTYFNVHTEEMPKMCFPQNDVYSSGVKCRSVRQLFFTLYWVMHIFAVLSLSLQLCVIVPHDSCNKSSYLKEKVCQYLQTWTYDYTKAAATLVVGILASLDN